MSIGTLNGKAKTKKVIPFGTRILVKRRSVGKTLGSGLLYAPDSTADTLTELAEVIALPELTLADKALLENAERIVDSLSKMASDGDAKSVDSLLEFNRYLQIKTLKVGDIIMVGRYNTIEFTVGETGESLSLTDPEGIRGLIVEKS